MPEYTIISNTGEQIIRLQHFESGMVVQEVLTVKERIVLQPEETQRLREALNPFHSLDDLPARHCPLCGFSGCVCGAADIQAEARAELRALRGFNGGEQ